jgi:hypothetical protein
MGRRAPPEEGHISSLWLRCAAQKKSNDAGQKPLVFGAKGRIYSFAQIARACGRVSVGGDPDKRPVNRRYKNRQPEANRRTPPSTEDRDLKQRRTGLFWSLLALQRLTYRRGLSFLPGVRKGTSPSNRWLFGPERHAFARVFFLV